MESNTAMKLLPQNGATTTTLDGDCSTAISCHVSLQNSHDATVQAPESTTHQRINTSASSPSPAAASVSLSPPQTSVLSTLTSHLNPAALHSITQLTALTAVATEKVFEDEQFLRTFSPLNENTSKAVTTAVVSMCNGGLYGGSTEMQWSYLVDAQKGTVVQEDRAPCPDPNHCQCLHCDVSHKDGLKSERPVTMTMTGAVASVAASATELHLHAVSQDLVLVQHAAASGVHRGNQSSGSPKSTSCSNEVLAGASSLDSSSLGTETLSRVNSAVHPPSLVGRVVGHRPREYHKWVWRKAEDYHELHALNVHNNNVYRQKTRASRPRPLLMEAVAGGVSTVCPYGMLTRSPTTTSWTSSLSLCGAAGDVSLGGGTGVLEAARSTVPFDSSSSPFLEAIGLMNTAATSGSNCGGAKIGGPAATPTINLPVDSRHLPLIGGAHKGGGGLTAGSDSLSQASDISFEHMSKLSMYTIPTSRQGPEYFKTAVEDNTKTLVIFMVGLPARGKTFLAQKICRLLGWHGTRAKVQNIQVAWRHVLLEWEAAHTEAVAGGAKTFGQAEQGPKAPNSEAKDDNCGSSGGCETPRGVLQVAGAVQGNAVTAAPLPTAATVAPAGSNFKPLNRLAHILSTQDDMTQVMCHFVAESARTSPRHPMAASVNNLPALASAHASTTTGTAMNVAAPRGYNGGSVSLSGVGVAAGPLPSASTSICSLGHNIPPVCPSMLAHTLASMEAAVVAPTAADLFTSVSPHPTEGRLSSIAEVDATAGGLRLPVSSSSPMTARLAGTARSSSDWGLEASAETTPRKTVGVDGSARPAEVLRTRHFRDLIEQPNSIARSLYRCVLQSFADDCRLFFEHGGEVVVVNDDFVTEELRQEAENFFQPLAAQCFYIEVIRDAKEDPLDFVHYKIHDPVEYPHSTIDPHSAADDFHERLAFLESVYETLEEAPKKRNDPRHTPSMSTSGTAVTEAGAAREGVFKDQGVGTELREDPALALSPTTSQHQPPPPQRQQQQQRSKLSRSYVKVINSSIETHGVYGYLASRIISYVMNLSQVKIQHPIYFMRHGESYYNLEDRLGGNPPLTEKGMQDAEGLLEFLSSLKCHLEHVDRVHHEQYPTHQPVQAGSIGGDERCGSSKQLPHANTADTLEIWTSQLRRAIQTTELSERLLGIRTLRWSSLNEIHAGICEDMTYAEVKKRYPLIDYFRKRSKYTFRYPSGESYQDLVLRLEPVIMELENADRVVVVVAHQAVLRCLLAYFGSTSAESSIHLKVPHRTIWRCTYNSKGIASLDELKLDCRGAGLHHPQNECAPIPSSTDTTAA